MIIITNPGSNLSPAALTRYDVRPTPQQIVVDGVAHDSRSQIAPGQIDEWVAGAAKHPHVVGTTAAEFAGLFNRYAKEDDELLVIMSSRKIIGSYDAAKSAAALVMARRNNVRIEVFDTRITDVGAGLFCVLAGESRQAGRSLSQTLSVLAAARDAARLRMIPRTLDWLVAGGRATAVRAFAARLLNVVPLLGFVDGEVQLLDRISRKASYPEMVAKALVKDIPEGQPVWVGAAHGGDYSGAREVIHTLRKTHEVAFAYVWHLSPSIYLHGGPGMITGMVIPIGSLGWLPPSPPKM